jgi:DNA-binding NarL/FixJ family response regulator
MAVDFAGRGCDLASIPDVSFENDPDVLILDTGLPGFDVKSTIQRILARYPNIRIVALSASSLPKDIVKLIAAGAQAYLPRCPKIGELKDAVETVISNRIYISQRLTDNESPGRDDSLSASRPTEPETLTAREREILKLLADGHTSRKIGGMLGISEKTVESHRGNIKAKLGIGSVAELTKYAIKHKITSLGA